MRSPHPTSRPPAGQSSPSASTSPAGTASTAARRPNKSATSTRNSPCACSAPKRSCVTRRQAFNAVFRGQDGTQGEGSLVKGACARFYQPVGVQGDDGAGRELDAGLPVDRRAEPE